MRRHRGSCKRRSKGNVPMNSISYNYSTISNVNEFDKINGYVERCIVQ